MHFYEKFLKNARDKKSLLCRLRNLEDGKKAKSRAVCRAHIVCIPNWRQFSWTGARPSCCCFLSREEIELCLECTVWKPVEQVSSKTINCKPSTPAQYPITRPMEKPTGAFQARSNCGRSIRSDL